jgi:hypothetical protein
MDYCARGISKCNGETKDAQWSSSASQTQDVGVPVEFSLSHDARQGRRNLSVKERCRCVGRPLQPSLHNLESFPHAYMLDAFLHPVRLCADFDFALFRPELLVKAVSLPHLLEICLGVDHGKSLPR